MQAVAALRSGLPVISEHRTLRLSLVFLLYIAQGIPLGMFYIAIPAWLAANGASALAIGGFLSATSLPWTLKFFNGFIMERYPWLPMGRRRAWLIGSQLVIVGGLLTMAAMSPEVTDVALLSALSFCINVATTFQDVATDGMAVDLVPDGERAQANSLMFGGQALGMAGAGAAAGLGIAVIGISGVTLIAALFVLALVGLLLVCRERPGERLLPWSVGVASPCCEALHLGAWTPIFGKTWVAMRGRQSLILLGVLVTSGAAAGYYSAVAPLMGAQYPGWSEGRISGLMATSSLTAGVLAVLAYGAIAGRFTPRRTGIGAMLLLGALMIMILSAQPAWSAGWPVTVLTVAGEPLNYLATICFAAIAMRLCAPAVAATQFTLYMATSNFGRTLASASIDMLDALGGVPAIVGALGASALTAAALFWMLDQRPGIAPGPFPAPAQAFS